jgi:hypothetical protein
VASSCEYDDEPSGSGSAELLMTPLSFPLRLALPFSVFHSGLPTKLLINFYLLYACYILELVVFKLYYCRF